MFSRKLKAGILPVLFLTVLTVICLMPAFAFAEQALEAPVPGPTVDSRALDELKLMSETISKAKTARFQTQSMVPLRTPAGLWINLYGTSQVVMQGRDKLFVSTAGDFAPHDFYFDGKTVTSYAPVENLYAVKPAPATLDAVIEEAYAEQGRSFPFADILVAEPYNILIQDLTSAFYVGQSTLKGVKTNHLLFSNSKGGVEWQIWIGVEDHLPRLVAATYLDILGEPTYTVEFENWKLNEPVDPKTFVFQNTSQAGKTEFRNLKEGV